MTLVSLLEWNNYIQSHPEAHLLQDGCWGELKADFGWKVYRIVSDSGAGAQILFRKLPGGLSFGYIPKGPMGSDWKSLQREVDQLCRQQNAVFLKIEPDAWEPLSIEMKTELAGCVSGVAVQPRRTLIINLEGDEQQ